MKKHRVLLVFQEDLFKILDEPPTTNNVTTTNNNHSNIFDVFNPIGTTSSNPLEDILFSDDPSTSNGLKTQHLSFDLKKKTQTKLRFRFLAKISNSIPSMIAFDKNGLKINLTFERQDTTLLIYLQAMNSTSSPILNFVFKAAVPKVNFLIDFSVFKSTFSLDI